MKYENKSRLFMVQKTQEAKLGTTIMAIWACLDIFILYYCSFFWDSIL
jgi:hypothetical protein